MVKKVTGQAPLKMPLKPFKSISCKELGFFYETCYLALSAQKYHTGDIFVLIIL